MAPSETTTDGRRSRRRERTPSYRPWAELLRRTFAMDILACPKCHGRMRLLAMVEDPANVAPLLARRSRCCARSRASVLPLASALAEPDASAAVNARDRLQPSPLNPGGTDVKSA